jgi:hypothetical protein
MEIGLQGPILRIHLSDKALLSAPGLLTLVIWLDGVLQCIFSLIVVNSILINGKGMVGQQDRACSAQESLPHVFSV